MLKDWSDEELAYVSVKGMLYQMKNVIFLVMVGLVQLVYQVLGYVIVQMKRVLFLFRQV